MTQPIYRFRNFNSGVPSVTQVSSGSPLVVCNLNTGVRNVPDTGEPGDPWLAWAGQTGEQPLISDSSHESEVFSDFRNSVPNHQNIRPIQIPARFQYANFYHIWSINETVSTAPRIQVYGKLPDVQLTDGDAKKFPFDDEHDFPDPADFWVPLVEPDETNTYMEFGTTAAGRFGAQLFISKPRYVYLQGCTHILCLINTAAAFSAGPILSSTSSGVSISEFSSVSSSSSAGQVALAYGVIAVQLSG